MLAFFIILRTLFLMTASPFNKLHSNLKFLISHCETGLRDYIRMHTKPMSTNRASALYRSVLSLHDITLPSPQLFLVPAVTTIKWTPVDCPTKMWVDLAEVYMN